MYYTQHYTHALYSYPESYLDVSANNWYSHDAWQGDGSGFTQEFSLGLQLNAAVAVLNHSNNNIRTEGATHIAAALRYYMYPAYTIQHALYYWALRHFSQGALYSPCTALYSPYTALLSGSTGRCRS
jgi:hypothetical protein